MADDNIDYDNERRTLHPDTYRAFESVDAQMFTGDPGETEDMFNLIKFYIDRWNRKMLEVAEDPWFKQAAAMKDEDDDEG